MLFRLFSVKFSMESLAKCKITITHVYYSVLTLDVSGGLGFKQLPQATATVNA